MDSFSQDGVAVIESAKAHAHKYHHSHISPEHMLLGVVEAGGPEALKIIKRGRATPDQVVQLVRHHLREGEHDIPADKLTFSERGKRVLEAARQASARAKAPKVDARHILLGLSTIPHTVAAAVLGAIDLKGEDAFS
jgi:ATP-dependent Clp protease ATP-binding subunit ClpA